MARTYDLHDPDQLAAYREDSARMWDQYRKVCLSFDAETGRVTLMTPEESAARGHEDDAR